MVAGRQKSPRDPLSPPPEVSISGPTRVTTLAQGEISTGTVTPGDLGLAAAAPDALRVCSPEESAEVIRSVLAGEAGPARDFTLANAAAALAAAGRAEDLAAGVRQAAGALDSGAARRVLEQWVEITNA